MKKRKNSRIQQNLNEQLKTPVLKYITRTLWILWLVCLFTDKAREMLYQITPNYLRSNGFSIILIGILKGIAEATAGLSKGYDGKLSGNFVDIKY